MARLRVVLFFFLSLSAAFAQVYSTPETVKVKGLRYQTARTSDDAAAAAIATVVGNPDVCCGRGSSLEDVVAAVNRNLEETAKKLQGRHVLPDGRPYVMSATFYASQSPVGTPPAASVIVAALRGNHPLLMVWKSTLYVIDGANYTENIYRDADNGSGEIDTVDELQLFDPATGRHTTFERTKDNWDDVQGMVTLTLGPSSS